MAVISRLRWFFQRGRRGWSDRDAWNFDCYLASVIVGGIGRLKKISHGVPADLSEKLGLEKATEVWGQMLDDVIFTFDYLKGDPWVPKEWSEEWYVTMKKIDDEYPGVPKTALTEDEFNRYRRGWEIFQDRFGSFWD